MNEEQNPTELPQEHGVAFIAWNNLGMYFRGQCLCGWETDPSNLVENVGADFDGHLREVMS